MRSSIAYREEWVSISLARPDTPPPLFPISFGKNVSQGESRTHPPPSFPSHPLSPAPALPRVVWVMLAKVFGKGGDSIMLLLGAEARLRGCKEAPGGCGGWPSLTNRQTLLHTEKTHSQLRHSLTCSQTCQYTSVTVVYFRAMLQKATDIGIVVVISCT